MRREWKNWAVLAGIETGKISISSPWVMSDYDEEPATTSKEGKPVYSVDQWKRGEALSMARNTRYNADKNAEFFKDLHARILSNDITTTAAGALFVQRFSTIPSEYDATTSRRHTHNALRLAYENQMLEAVGGRAANVEMVVGGWIGRHQIHKINKSNASGQVVSVIVKAQDMSYADANGKRYEPGDVRPLVDCRLNVERLEAGAYRPPEAGDVEAVETIKAAEKAIRPKRPSLINPTPEAAQRLQGLFNAVEAAKSRPSYAKPFKPSQVAEMAQAQYKRDSGDYGDSKTKWIGADGLPTYEQYRGNVEKGAVCKVRVMSNGYSEPASVIVLTDKPQKVLPKFAAKEEPKPEPVAVPVAEPVPATTGEQREMFGQAALF